MEEKTIKALRWVVKILNENYVPYKIGGGFAASIYGSPRPVNDIDISLSGKYFPIIVPKVSHYITAGPKHYLNEKWDCETLSLNYQGQDIDMTDVDSLKMTNKEKTGWIQVKERRIFDAVTVNMAGVDVSIMDPRDLITYKKELDGNHQLVDIKAIKKYITTHNLTP